MNWNYLLNIALFLVHVFPALGLPTPDSDVVIDQAEEPKYVFAHFMVSGRLKTHPTHTT